MGRQAKASPRNSSAARKSRPRFLRCVTLLVLIASVLFSLNLSQAFAGEARLRIGSFDGSATAAGSFGSEDTKLAIDQSQGAIYVLDPEHGVIDKFDTAGTLQDFSALASPELDGVGVGDPDQIPEGSLGSARDIAVDNSGGGNAGNIYVTSDSRLYAFAASGAFLWSVDGSGPAASGGTPSGSLDSPCGVAIDTSGAIYVAGQGTGAVRKFVPAAGTASYDSETFPATQEPFGERSPCHIATDGLNHLFAVGFFAHKFDLSTGLLLHDYLEADEKIDTAVAVNPLNDHVLIAHALFIKEFDSGDAQIGAPFARTERGYTSIATHAGSDKVFVSTGALNISNPSAVLIYGPLTVTTPATSTVDTASSVTANSAHVSGTVNPNGFFTEWHFEYSADSSSWTEVGTDQIAGAGSVDVAVSADITNLEPNTQYHVRLVATNEGEDKSVSPETTFTTEPAPPIVEPLFAARITETSALLGAKINPRNASTTYFIEYSSDASFAESVSIPVTQNGVVGSANSPVVVTNEVADLKADATYYFRAVAENQAGQSLGAARSFKTLAVGTPINGLPDGRVYEKVSPLDKHGADVNIGDPGQSAASESGKAVAFWSRNVSFDGDGAPLAQSYISRRGAFGWSTTGIMPPIEALPSLSQGFGSYSWFSADLSKGFVKTPAAINPGDPKGIFNAYLRDTTGDTYQLLSIYDAGLVPTPSSELNTFETPTFSGATPDGSHILFHPIHQLTTDGPNKCGLYEWTNGEVRPVGILPDGTLAPAAVPGSMNRCGVVGESYSGAHFISDDGSRIYFSVPREGSGKGGPVYVRVNGTTTQNVSTSEAPGPEPSDDHVHFELASASNGSLAFFTDDQKRTIDAAPGNNLYRWDANAIAGSRLMDITKGDLENAGVVDVLGASDDATRVYFRSTGVLAPGGIRDQRNIYLWQEGGSTRYVTQGDARGRVRISPDGRHMLFESRDRLTAYDNAGHAQLYLYDAGSNELTCVSCNPRSDGSKGDASLFTATLPFTLVPRNLSNDGERVFFNSTEALVPQDTNGRTDVYEWGNGRAALISSGSGKGDSVFLDASISGDDVFFTTGEQLVRSDTDDLIDVYDARVGGQPEPPIVPGCLGDECQGTPKAPPIFDNPSTSIYGGPGNPVSAKSKSRCGHGKRAVHRRGKTRCAPKRRRVHKPKAQATAQARAEG